MRAYTRVDDRPIRRHDSVEQPDVVVVLEPTLVCEGNVIEGLADGGLVLLNAESPPEELAGCDVRCVPAARLASVDGSGFVNLVMLGALAGALDDPPLGELQEAAVEHLGAKADPDGIRHAVEEGYRCLS
jgi:pyruvate ferredoxin oxidoreductase gamma subunit